MFSQSFFFLGCDGFELTPEVFRVRDEHRDIQFGWPVLEGGGIALRDRERAVSLPSGEGAIGAAMQQFSAMRDTHDALWIKHGSGLIIALIEREHPKRDALLDALERHLGSHWFGRVFTSAELAERFSYQSPQTSVGLRTPIVLMGVVMLVIFGIALLIALLH